MKWTAKLCSCCVHVAFTVNVKESRWCVSQCYFGLRFPAVLLRQKYLQLTGGSRRTVTAMPPVRSSRGLGPRLSKEYYVGILLYLSGELGLPHSASACVSSRFYFFGRGGGRRSDISAYNRQHQQKKNMLICLSPEWFWEVNGQTCGNRLSRASLGWQTVP